MVDRPKELYLPAVGELVVYRTFRGEAVIARIAGIPHPGYVDLDITLSPDDTRRYCYVRDCCIECIRIERRDENAEVAGG
jgi:hypothetical protein